MPDDITLAQAVARLSAQFGATINSLSMIHMNIAVIVFDPMDQEHENEIYVSNTKDHEAVKAVIDRSQGRTLQETVYTRGAEIIATLPGGKAH